LVISKQSEVVKVMKAEAFMYVKKRNLKFIRILHKNENDLYVRFIFL